MHTAIRSTLPAWLFIAAMPFATINFADAQDRSGSRSSGGSSYGGSSYGGGSRDSQGNECSSSQQFQRSSLSVVGLTSDLRLVCFNERSPDSTTNIGSVAGLAGDTSLVGIDFRVQDGKLYGVGNAGGIYILNTSNAVAIKVSQLTIALAGASFGVDFNPAADRLRIISDTGQNLRHNVNAGGVTVADGTLTYSTAAAPATGVTGAAYTNNDLDASTATTLYDIDSNLDQVVIQSPANNGTLAATGKLTVDTSSTLGFDIYSTIRNGVTVEVQALAVLKGQSDGVTRLYSINLPTGKATPRGTFNNSTQVIDIAIPLNQL